LKFDAAHWRERAREMRAFAEKAGDEETAHRMLRVAADYDKLAERAEAADSEPPES
jgi:DNA-binding ferritin-like protein